MAIIRCPECKNKISNSSKICIKCGYTLTDNDLKGNQNDKALSHLGIGISISITILIIATIVITALSNNNKVVVPNFSGVDEATAKSLLTNTGLLPVVKYDYSDTVNKKMVISTFPNYGNTVEKGEAVTLHVSKGPSHINATNSNIGWLLNSITNIVYGIPYIENEELYINITKIEYATALAQRGYGIASINDTFDKNVPIVVTTDKTVYSKGEIGTALIKIPITDLDVQRPTTLYIRMATLINNNSFDLPISITISWPSE